MKVLLVEDHASLRKSVGRGLREAGYAVDCAADGEEGFYLADTGEYDVIVLDLMLPKQDGLTVLRRLRAKDNPARVLILTARDTVSDRVRGLDLGADDYLTKPFAHEELLARVRSLVRRRYEANAPVVHVGDLAIDTSARSVHRAGRRLELSGREYAILELLVLRAGQVVSRTEIWEHVYDFQAEPNSNVIDVYIAHLRKHLEWGGQPRLIHTRRGMGYVLAEPV